MTIGIISHAADDHAAAVASVLEASGRKAVLIDTAAFPVSMSLTFGIDRSGGVTSLLSLDGQIVDLTQLDVIWWRRPQPYVLHADLDPSSAGFAYSECHEAMSGALHSLPARWVNPPGADEIAHHKPLQLAVAQSLGLRVPQTLITNDPAAAKNFAASRGIGNTIFKTFLASEHDWRETRQLKESDMLQLDSVRAAPVIFQEYVAATSDLRVTVFGDELHATEIFTPSDAYAFDYRVSLDQVAMRETSLPAEITCMLLQMMDKLGLVYGAIDMRRTADDEYTFLEINPSGEFLFVEERSGQKLTAAMAGLLCGLEAAAA